MTSLNIWMAAAFLSVPPDRPIPTARVTVPAGTLAQAAAAVEQQTGIPIDLSAADGSVAVGPLADVPFWQAAERLAPAGFRVRPGKRVAFVKGDRTPTASEGAFRVAAKGVTARSDYETGRAAYDLQLELAWEPRFPVFRVDAQPTITTAVDDRGTKLTVPAVGAKSPTSGFTHTTSVRLDGLTRESRKVAKLAGSFTVTASPRMLPFAFDDLAGPLPQSKQQDGVTVTLAGFVRREDRWDVTLKLEYPVGHPEFESFESWTGGNTIRLVPPSRTGAVAEESFDVIGTGRTATAEYRFSALANLNDRKGWRLVYETPAPLVEFPVRFELTDLRLP